MKIVVADVAITFNQEIPVNHLNETHSGTEMPCAAPSFPTSPKPSFGFLNDIHPEPPEGSLRAVMSRRGGHEPFFPDDRRFVAVQKSGPSDSADEHLGFWMGRLLTVGLITEDEIKVGAMLWDQLALKVPLQLTERLLLLKDIDEETARAAQSALIGTFNSSSDPSDLEAAVLTLSTFLNVHPSFHHLAVAPDPVAPFGASTTYELATIGTPES